MKLPPAEKKKLRAAATKRGALRLLRLSYEFRGTLAIGLVALAFVIAINLGFPFVLRKVLNEELGMHIAHDLPLITLVFILLFVVQAVFCYMRDYCFTVAGYNIVAKLRNSLYAAIIKQDSSFFDQARVGDLLSRLTSDTQMVQRAVGVNISVALRYLLQVFVGIVLMLVISVKLTLVITLLIPLLIIGSFLFAKKLQRYSRLMQENLGEASIIAEETLSSPQTVRLFSGAAYEMSRYGKMIEASLSSGIKRTKVAALFASSMQFLTYAGIACVVCYGGTLVVDKTLSVGDLTAFLILGVIVAVSFGFLASAWDEFMQAVGASERIFEILDTRPTIVRPESPQTLPVEHAASVSFENVSFSYPSRPSVPVLKNISFEIHAGETIAFVGPSGAGKSTIAQLIPRFYDPNSGVIRFSGVPLTSIDPDELRKSISMVAQNPQVFSFSLRENIRYGKLDATQAEIEEAAKAAKIHEFIVSLPQGYDTLLGDRGIQVSGGERQRVAIARALLKDPRFLILDEATSALDSENEQLVQQALTRLMKGRTSLIIAHRLSTVQHADKVIVVRNGEICQIGTHQELVQVTGLYKTLVEHQLL